MGPWIADGRGMANATSGHVVTAILVFANLCGCAAVSQNPTEHALLIGPYVRNIQTDEAGKLIGVEQCTTLWVTRRNGVTRPWTELSQAGETCRIAPALPQVASHAGPDAHASWPLCDPVQDPGWRAASYAGKERIYNHCVGVDN
jgi:hypothetical protein